MDGAPMPRYGGFGERNANKSTKAVIGVAILIVLSLVLYELRSNRRRRNSLDETANKAKWRIRNQPFAYQPGEIGNRRNSSSAR
jgi:hypothetical protein